MTTFAEEVDALRVPTDDEWATIARKHRLSQEQITALKDLVEKSYRAIGLYMRRNGKYQPMHREQRDALKDFLSKLEKCRNALLVRSDASYRGLSSDTFADILSNILSTDAIAAFSETSAPEISRRVLDSRDGSSNNPTAVQRALNDAYWPWRAGVCGDHTGDVLRGLFDALRSAAAAQLRLVESASGSRGGRPGQRVRGYILEGLALASSSILGGRPTTTPAGPYMSMAADLVVALGLSDTGVEAHAARILSRINNDLAEPF